MAVKCFIQIFYRILHIKIYSSALDDANLHLLTMPHPAAVLVAVQSDARKASALC